MKIKICCEEMRLWVKYELIVLRVEPEIPAMSVVGADGDIDSIYPDYCLRCGTKIELED